MQEAFALSSPWRAQSRLGKAISFIGQVEVLREGLITRVEIRAVLSPKRTTIPWHVKLQTRRIV